MRKLIEYLIGVLGLLPTFSIGFSYGYFLAIAPDLFHFFSVTDHIINAASFGLYIVILAFSLLTGAIFLNISRLRKGVGKSTLKEDVQPRTRIDSSPYYLLSLGLFIYAVSSVLEIKTFKLASIGLIGTLFSSVGALLLLCLVRYHRLKYVPIAHYQGLILFVSFFVTIITGSISGELRLNGVTNSPVCATTFEQPDVCDPVFFAGSDRALIGSESTQLVVVPSRDLVFRVQRNTRSQ